jgi:hypothetical protein
MRPSKIPNSLLILVRHGLIASAVVSCSSPVNITSSSSLKLGSDQQKSPYHLLPLPLVAEGSTDESLSPTRGFFAPCTSCNGYLLVMLTEAGKSVQMYDSFTKIMYENGFKILAYEIPHMSASVNDSVKKITQKIRTDLATLISDNDNWKDFVTPDGEPAWGKIVINGIGHSSSLAIRMAQTHRLARVCSFHGPWNENADSQHATWLSDAFATPVRRLNFMIHKHEAGKDTIAKFESILRLMSVSVDLSSWTRLETPALYASLQGQSCKDTASCLIEDPIPTDESGRPIYQHAWRHLCVPPSMSDSK